MVAPRAGPVRFREPVPVRAVDPTTSAVWECTERQTELPKPGGGARVARLVKGLLSPQEGRELLAAAKALDFEGGAGGSSSVAMVDVMQAGQYQGGPFSGILRPLVDARLLPYVRHRYGCPGAVVCSASVHRHASSGDGELGEPVQCSFDRLYYCTVLVALNPEDVQGGIYLQGAPGGTCPPAFVPLDCGDALAHQHDLPRGVRVRHGDWYCAVFRFKDSILACLTNTTPWYAPLAEQGDADAQASLAFLQECGGGGGPEEERTPASAARWYSAAAEQGHPDAQERLGSLHMHGECGLPEDAAKAVHWWHKAALQGRHTAQRRLAEALLRGRGAERNEAEALQWLQRSAEQGDVEAMYLLVVAYSTGIGSGGAPDLQLALAWCERGARAGHAELQQRLAVQLLAGEGLPQDFCQAVKWSHKAAESGHPRAQCNMGVLFAQGVGGLPRDVERARDWFQRAAFAGDAVGRYNLARLLARGLGGLPKDLEAAKDWCRLAVGQGLSKAASLLEDLELDEHCQTELAVPQDGRSSPSAPPTRTSDTSHSGPPLISMDMPQCARLRKLLSELHDMRGAGASKMVEDLIDILQCLEKASQVGPAVEVVQTSQLPSPVESQISHDKDTEAPLGDANDPDHSAAGQTEGTPSDRAAALPGSSPRETPGHEGLASAAAGGAAPDAPVPQAPEETPVPAQDHACGARPQRRHPVPRVSARRGVELRRAVAAGEPVLVTDAMPHLSGKRVVEFMPKLINAAGKEQMSYEVQGPGSEVTVRQTPLAVYVQELQRSAPGRARLLLSDQALRHPELAEFLVAPGCFGTDCLSELPAELRPPEVQGRGADGRCLLVGGAGATSRLHRSSVMSCTWNLLVLGRARWHLFPPATAFATLSAQACSWGSDASSLDTFSEDPGAFGPDWPPEQVWEATQEISEVLLLPPGWWSQARHQDRSLAVLGQQLPEALLPYAAEQVSRWLDLSQAPKGSLRSPREVFEVAAEEVKRRGLSPGHPGLLAALRSPAAPEPRPSPAQPPPV